MEVKDPVENNFHTLYVYLVAENACRYSLYQSVDVFFVRIIFEVHQFFTSSPKSLILNILPSLKLAQIWHSKDSVFFIHFNNGEVSIT